MKRSGIIYDSKRHARKLLAYQASKGLVGGVISYFIVSFILLYFPIIFAPKTKTANFATTNTFVTDEYLNTQAIETVQVQKETEALKISSQFSLYIPKISAATNIVANTDTSNEAEYFDALKKGVAHAKGTYFPGQGKTVYLFAHSTDSPLNFVAYNAVFYQLSLLDRGDTITVYFANKKYVYAVSDTKTVEASEVSWLVRDFGGEKLILQTCTPPGTTWRRLLVFADPVWQMFLLMQK